MGAVYLCHQLFTEYIMHSCIVIHEYTHICKYCICKHFNLYYFHLYYSEHYSKLTSLSPFYTPIIVLMILYVPKCSKPFIFLLIPVFFSNNFTFIFKNLDSRLFHNVFITCLIHVPIKIIVFKGEHPNNSGSHKVPQSQTM